MNGHASSLKINIEQIGISRLNDAYSIVQEVTNYLDANGLKHWNSHYTMERLAQYLEERTVYLLTYQGIPVGVNASTTEKNSSGWRDSVPSLYLSTLAVRPQYHRRGFGSLLLTAAEEEARERGLEKIRFDSIRDWPYLRDFYERRGYKVVGEWGRPYRKYNYFLFERDVNSLAQNFTLTSSAGISAPINNPDHRILSASDDNPSSKVANIGS